VLWVNGGHRQVSSHHPGAWGCLLTQDRTEAALITMQRGACVLGGGGGLASIIWRAKLGLPETGVRGVWGCPYRTWLVNPLSVYTGSQSQGQEKLPFVALEIKRGHVPSEVLTAAY
jgi:hypothetical protein